MENNLLSLRKTARFAGLLYLLWIMTAIYGLMYVQPLTIVNNDPAATANKILSHEFIFRTGIVNSILSSVIWLLLGLTLYRLFKNVNKQQAMLLVALVTVQIPVVFISEALSYTALALFKHDILPGFEASQRFELAMVLLKISTNTTIILEMYWGLWLFPFGYLVLKSNFIPRILGHFLIINGVAYVIHCLAHLLLPQHQKLIFQIATPFWTLGEISIMLWLLIKGVRFKASNN